MSKLGEVIADPLSTVQGNRKPQSGVKKPKSNFIAAAFVVAGTLPDLGQSYTPPNGGSAATLTAATLPGVLKKLCYAGLASFFGNGQINGKRGKFSEFKEAFAYGTRTTPRPTGLGEYAYMIDYADQLFNVEFFNALRERQTPYDIYLFSDAHVEIVRWSLQNPVYQNIGTAVDGDIKKDIPGAFEIACTSQGEPLPAFGVVLATLTNDVAFTFGAPTVTNLTPVVGGINRFSMASTAATLTPVLNEATQAAGSGIAYSVFLNTSDAAPAAVTVNTSTGVVSIATTLTTGTYRFTLVVENATGVTGSYSFTIDKA
ncbi:hypothetical protein FAES_1824 [Fibrella aestuarina BUZ 2]|uniref:Uncharacterized protein n=1 Tax=Fibrella aestuarina BUZ 2 TaxID=1166018 RepID=I0K6T1_9BACT|nr:Ig domain-containing protein [Fibrella aestuarina]CCG99834.1 hypothetical protein FAES_1824 [Fibrella aestuarina BUZ 2]